MRVSASLGFYHSIPLILYLLVGQQGRVVQKLLINTNPGLKVDRGFNFSGMKVLTIAYVLWGLSTSKLENVKYTQKAARTLS